MGRTILAVVVGIVLLIVGLGVEIAGWGRTPVWYHLVFLALLIPGVLVGAKLSRRSASGA
jgi:hypothetical protein